MSKQKASATGGLKGMAQAHAVEILNLPDEPEEGYHALPESDATWQLKHNGFFIDCGYCDGTHPNCDIDLECSCMVTDCECRENARCDTKIWRISPQGREMLEQVEEPETLPCGHQGLRNLRDGGYTCQKESCDNEFSKATAKRLF